jgi:hypothetical protein
MPGREGNLSEGVPKVFPERGRDGLLTVEGELSEGGVVLASGSAHDLIQ